MNDSLYVEIQLLMKTQVRLESKMMIPFKWNHAKTDHRSMTSTLILLFFCHIHWQIKRSVGDLLLRVFDSLFNSIFAVICHICCCWTFLSSRWWLCSFCNAVNWPFQCLCSKDWHENPLIYCVVLINDRAITRRLMDHRVWAQRLRYVQRWEVQPTVFSERVWIKAGRNAPWSWFSQGFRKFGTAAFLSSSKAFLTPSFSRSRCYGPVRHKLGQREAAWALETTVSHRVDWFTVHPAKIISQYFK